MLQNICRGYLNTLYTKRNISEKLKSYFYFIMNDNGTVLLLLIITCILKFYLYFLYMI